MLRGLFFLSAFIRPINRGTSADTELKLDLEWSCEDFQKKQHRLYALVNLLGLVSKQYDLISRV
jgi:hypothetical protein